MEVTVKNEREVTKLPFPKLMISKNDVIVLFMNKTLGICVAPKDRAERYAKLHDGNDDWNIENFKDFKGEITIKQ